MRVRINGEEQELENDTTVSGLVERLGLRPERVAVERNRLVVRRTEWTATVLAPNDELEILTFVGGG